MTFYVLVAMSAVMFHFNMLYYVYCFLGKIMSFWAEHQTIRYTCHVPDATCCGCVDVATYCWYSTSFVLRLEFIFPVAIIAERNRLAQMASEKHLNTRSMHTIMQKRTKLNSVSILDLWLVSCQQTWSLTGWILDFDHLCHAEMSIMRICMFPGWVGGLMAYWWLWSFHHNCGTHVCCDHYK